MLLKHAWHVCTNVSKPLEEEKNKSLIPILRKSWFCEFPFNWGKAIHGTAKTKLFILPRPEEKFFNIIGYVIKGFTEYTRRTVWILALVFHTIADGMGQSIGYCLDASGLLANWCWRILFYCYILVFVFSCLVV